VWLKLFIEFLVLLRNALVEVSLIELFHDVVVIRVQLLGVLLIDLINLEERSLDGSEAEEEAEAHVEHLCLEVDVLDPDLSRFHVLADVLDCSFKELLDQLVALGPEDLLVVLQELDIARPQVNLGGVVPDRLLEDLRSFLDCALELSGLLGVLAGWALLSLLILDEEVGVASNVRRINRVPLTYLL